MSSSSSTGYFANGYLCHCGARSVVRTAWTIGNFGRRFRGCSRYKREVVARGMEARAREKEMMTRKKEKMYMHALVVS
uniref:Uncharacterized protein n=1 Tax=Fagus sylvatica TaxID=28930 RepID=A0A2N9J6K7_FAGSY